MMINRKNNKILKRFIISYVIILLVPMLTMSFFFLFHFVNVLSDEVEKNLLSPLEKSVENLDAEIEQLLRTSVQIEMNETLVNTSIDERPYEASLLKKELLKYSNNSFIDDIFFYNDRYNYLTSYNYICSYDLFRDFIIQIDTHRLMLDQLLDSNQRTGYLFFPENSMQVANRENHIMYLNKIPLNSMRQTGFVMYMIPESSLYRLLEPGISENSLLLILDSESKEIIFSEAQGLNEDNLSDIQSALYELPLQPGEKYSIHGGQDRYTAYAFQTQTLPLSVVKITSDDFLSAQINQIRALYLAGMVLIILISGVVISVLIRYNYRPIKKMKKIVDDMVHPAASMLKEREGLNELELMEHVLMQYNQENKDLKEYARTHQSEVRRYLIDSYLIGQAAKIDEIEEVAKRAGLHFEKQYYSVIFIKSKQIKQLETHEVETLIDKILDADDLEILAHREIHFNNYVILFGTDIENDRRCRMLAEALIDAYQEKHAENLIVGIGNFYSSIYQISQSYQEAVKVVDFNHVIAKNQVISFNELSNQEEPDFKYPFELFEKLELNLEKKDLFAVQDVMRELLSFIKNENISVHWAKNICYNVVNVLMKDASRSGHRPPLIVNKPYIRKIYMSQINSFEDIQALMDEIMEDAAVYLEAEEEAYEVDLLRKIIAFINDNYSDPEFSLNRLADSMQLSRPYLSQYFKKNTDYTISDYVTRLRMDKAKTLLIKNALSIQEIAAEVGYYSVSSFIRKFRETQGLTPGQFKKKYLS